MSKMFDNIGVTTSVLSGFQNTMDGGKVYKPDDKKKKKKKVKKKKAKK
jgi:hypothetical protein